MEKKDTDEVEIDLLELWFVIRKRLWLILLVGILLGGSAGVGCKLLIAPKYSSKTQLYIVNKNQSLQSLSLSDLQLGSQLTKDYMVLVKSRPVIEQVISNLELSMKYEQLLHCLELSNPQDTRILEIKVVYSDPYLAKQIVDEVAKVSAKRISEIMDISEPKVVEEGVVTETPVSPNVKRNALIACAIGILLCGAVIVVRHILDDTIKSEEDIEQRLGLPSLGSIPVQKGLNGVEVDDTKHKK